MKCPHCAVTIHAGFRRIQIGQYLAGWWVVEHMECPQCHDMILYLIRGSAWVGGHALVAHDDERFIAYPKRSTRPPVPKELSDTVAIEDYEEAAEVLPVSPKASAALSRRCLQHILRECAQVRRGSLDSEIQQVLDGKLLPAHLAQALDAVRTIGNFAAHPIKSTSTGEVVSVELGEADWLLDVLDGLFDFYFVQPAHLAARRAALDAKLAAAGKPPLR